MESIIFSVDSMMSTVCIHDQYVTYTGMFNFCWMTYDDELSSTVPGSNFEVYDFHSILRHFDKYDS